MSRQNPARWRAIEARLGREMTIWLATVRYNGRPHLVPLWFVWLDEKIHLATGDHTQKFVNMYHNQNVSLALPDTGSVVIIEGEAHVADRNTVDRVADYFYHKYEWDFRYDETAVWRLIEITPNKIMAWGDGYETEGTRIL
jgi:general stress protein 26